MHLYMCILEQKHQLSFDTTQQYKGETGTFETPSFPVIPTLRRQRKKHYT